MLPSHRVATPILRMRRFRLLTPAGTACALVKACAIHYDPRPHSRRRHERRPAYYRARRLSALRRWFREPPLYFLLLGALLFAGYGLVKPRFRPPLTSRRIDITSGEVDQLAQAFERQWRRSPTPAELRGLVDDRIREEVLYREAVAMGLDRDDVVIRRRLAQKFQFLTEDLTEAHVPTDAELERYLATHRERYVAPSRLTFSQLYFSQARRGSRAQPDAVRALGGVARGRTPPPGLRGDPFCSRRGSWA